MNPIHNTLDQKYFKSLTTTYTTGSHVFTFGVRLKISVQNSFNLTAYENFGTFGTLGNYRFIQSICKCK
jgi:hypothetical protein